MNPRFGLLATAAMAATTLSFSVRSQDLGAGRFDADAVAGPVATLGAASASSRISSSRFDRLFGASSSGTESSLGSGSRLGTPGIGIGSSAGSLSSVGRLSTPGIGLGSPDIGSSLDRTLGLGSSGSSLVRRPPSAATSSGASFGGFGGGDFLGGFECGPDDFGCTN